MKYLFDANVFIRSKNEMPPELWPTFWIRIVDLIKTGCIYTSIKVKEEIDRGNDELAQWMKDNAPDSFYYPVDAMVLGKYAELQNWAYNTAQFTSDALQEFASVADAYLVATAVAKGMMIVTYEKSSPNSKRRVKIPDACMAMKVDFCDLNGVFRELGVTI